MAESDEIIPVELDDDNEFYMEIDSKRSLSITPTTDDLTVVLSVEDPQSVAIVELTRPELDELIDELIKYWRNIKEA
jgi:hypothetical protein